MTTVEFAGAVPEMTGRGPWVEPFAGVTTVGAPSVAGKAPGSRVMTPALPGAEPYVAPSGAFAVGCVPAAPPATMGVQVPDADCNSTRPPPPPPPVPCWSKMVLPPAPPRAVTVLAAQFNAPVNRA